MIAELSKAVTLYLAPLLALTAILLNLFAFLAPTLLLHTQVALLVISPSTILSKPGPSQDVDGPSLFLGILGSCSRPKNNAATNCTVSSISPQYDFSDLPTEAPVQLLSAPTTSTPVFIAIAIPLSIIFLITFTLISFRHKMSDRLRGVFERPLLQRISAWIGFFGFFIGITCFLIIRMWFGKAVDDFNRSIQLMSFQGAPQLVAETGNAFTMAWVAHAFLAVPVIVSMAKMNATFSK